MAGEFRIPVSSDLDIVSARQRGRALAEEIGFSGSHLTLIATAISEVARNIVSYAGNGEIVLQPTDDGRRTGILIVAKDNGPGIADIDAAIRDGFSTARSLGIGLPGAKRLMDEFEIVSELGKGTTVTMSKWL